MKTKFIAVISLPLLLLSSVYLTAGRVKTSGIPADFRDAPNDISALSSLKTATKAEAAGIPAASPVSSRAAIDALIRALPAGPVAGLSRTGNIPLPALGPDAGGWFHPAEGYTEGGTFSAAADKPEWSVPASGIKPAGKPGELRVMEWNVARGEHLDKAIRIIKKANPDVILLCETDLYGKVAGGRVAAREIASALGYSYYTATEFSEFRNDRLGSSGNAIVSRYPIIEGRSLMLPDLLEQGGKNWPASRKEPRTGHRNALAARIDVPGPNGAVRMNFVSLHIEDKAKAIVRRLQLKTILSELVVRGEPTVIAGDFNTCAINEVKHLRNFMKEETSFLDCSGGDDHPTYSVALVVRVRLDWTFMQPGPAALVTKAYDVLKKEGTSDHSPSVTTFHFN